MTDVHTPEQRSFNMSRIASKNTKPELVVRSTVHRMGFRFGKVTPATNSEFWRKKRADNVARDRRKRQQLKAAGWSVLVVWECWTRNPDRDLLPGLKKFLQPQAPGSPHRRSRPSS